MAAKTDPKDLSPEELNVASEKDKAVVKEEENLKTEADKNRAKELKSVNVDPKDAPEPKRHGAPVGVGRSPEDTAELNSLLSKKEGLVKKRVEIAEDGEMEENERRGKVAALYEEIAVLDDQITPLLPDEAK